jgi:hypothetical protein
VVAAGVFLLLWVPIVHFVKRHKTATIEDLDKGVPIDKFR